VASFSQSVGAVFAPSPLVAPNVAGISLPDAARLSREELLTYYVSRTSGDLPEPYVCGAGLSSFAISPEGKVLPCQLWRQEAGDLHRSSFDEIWRESPLFIWIRRLSANEQVSCAGCSNRSFCTPCPGMAYTESGNALLPNLYSCECARAHQEVFENGRKEAVRKARAHEA
jgi:radical SAM protein with 4Fe4S-binding SPASM domain